MSNRGWLRRLVLDIALSLTVVAALLLVAEVAARRLHLRSGYFVIPTEANCLRRSPSLGMEFRPNCATTWNDFLLTGASGTTFATNELGLRDAALSEDGAARILALGDSCTWGWQVAQDAAYPQRLQRLLDTELGSGKYRVINAGAPGYTSYQGLVYLRDRGLALRPRVVIIAFGFNDALPTGDVEADLARQRDRFTLIELDDYFLGHSALWRWGRSKMPGDGADRRPGEMADRVAAQPAPHPLRVPRDKFQQNLTQIVDLAPSMARSPCS